MTIEADIRTALTGHAGLSALVGTRIYPDKLPQNPTYPAIVYQRISTPRAQAISGTVASAAPRFQFSIYAKDASGVTGYDKSIAVATQLRAALLAMTGSTVTIHEVRLAGELGGWEDSPEITHRALDAIILHSE